METDARGSILRNKPNNTISSSASSSSSNNNNNNNRQWQQRLSPRGKVSSTIAGIRLYRAPLASIRGNLPYPRKQFASSSSTMMSSSVHQISPTGISVGSVSSTRRVPKISTQSQQSGSLQQEKETIASGGVGSRRRRIDGRESSNHSSMSNIDAIEAPLLWLDDNDDDVVLQVERMRKSPQQQYRQRRNNQGSHVHRRQHSSGASSSLRNLSLSHGNEDFSESLYDDDSFSEHNNRGYEATSLLGKKKSLRLSIRNFFSSYPNVIQLVVLLTLAVMTFRSHRRVEEHKMQLRQFDEERTHIIEQMMWIEKKKSRGSLSSGGLGGWRSGFALSAHDWAVQSTEDEEETYLGLRNQMEKIQLRIQLNERVKLQERFGENPIQVSLRINGDFQEQGEQGQTGSGQQQPSLSREDEKQTLPPQHLVIALSDDTPHATSIFLQQVDNGLWDDVEIERLEEAPSVIEASTKRTRTTPVLEFVEPSRGCHEAGSVAVHQVDHVDHLALVVRVRLSEDTPTDKDEVCIGKVVRGIEFLEELPLAPLMEDIM